MSARKRSPDDSVALVQEPEVIEEMVFVQGKAPETLPPNTTVDGRVIEVMSTRLLVSIEQLADYVPSPGGVLRPTGRRAPPSAEGMSAQMAQMGQMAEDLYEGTIVGLGQGRYNAETGVYAGSIYRVGDVVLFRRSSIASPFIDEIEGRDDLLIVQEDVVRARVHNAAATEVQALEEEGKL